MHILSSLLPYPSPYHDLCPLFVVPRPLAIETHARVASRRPEYLLVTLREASQSRRANRITWTVPVPTAMGLDVKALPEPPSERERGEDQRSRHVRQGSRRIAVASFNGIPQVSERAGRGGEMVRCQRAFFMLLCLLFSAPCTAPALPAPVYINQSKAPVYVNQSKAHPCVHHVLTLASIQPTNQPASHVRTTHTCGAHA